MIHIEVGVFTQSESGRQNFTPVGVLHDRANLVLAEARVHNYNTATETYQFDRPPARLVFREVGEWGETP